MTSPETSGTDPDPSLYPSSVASRPEPDDDSILAGILDEWTRRLRRGEVPDLDPTLRAHPRLEDELRSLWATLWIAETLARDELDPGPSSGDLTTGLHSSADEVPARASAWSPGRGPGPSPGLPARFGDYELLEELGRGGMGVVYRARELGQGRIVALKLLLRGAGSTPHEVERFRVEVLAAGNLAHPHIVPVFQVGEYEGQPFFTMLHVEGMTLARRLADGPMPGREAARMLIPVCRAIGSAHERGILHRDLKPSNILIDRQGHPYVGDFGLAKRLGPDAEAGASLTPSGALVGTPSYMPPEYAGGVHARGPGDRSRPAGPAGDVYGLGAILYHMLTGRPPYQAATAIETVRLVVEQDLIPPRLLNPRVEPDLEMIALRCLQKEPRLRYPSPVALADDLEAFLRDEPVSARSNSLRALVVRLLGETHQAPVMENWGYLWIAHAVALVVFFGTTNVLVLSGVLDRRPYVLLFSVGLGAWAALFWELRRRMGPIRFVERQLAHIWGSGIVGINMSFLVEWLMDMPALSLLPMFAVMNGMLMIVKAGVLSGFFYFQAAALFLTIPLMARFPRFAPLIFGLTAAACFLATGLRYRSPSRRSDPYSSRIDA